MRNGHAWILSFCFAGKAPVFCLFHGKASSVYSDLGHPRAPEMWDPDSVQIPSAVFHLRKDRGPLAGKLGSPGHPLR
jgi:hypothetical protein